MPPSGSRWFRQAIRPIRAAALVCSLIVLPLACAGTPPSVVTTARTSCLVGATGPAPVESISVATTTPIDPAHAPAPTNAGERFVFAQLYETLIDVDCDGRAYPGLARSWTIDATKTRVTLVLRDDARFWNGQPLGAKSVVDAWRATGATLADATTIVDDHTLTVSLPDTQYLVLAMPSLAVSAPTTGAAWPQGSGPYRVAASASDVAPGRLALLPMGVGTPRLTIRSGPDARDAIDAGTDVLPAAEPGTVSYVAARPDLTTIPLPWLRTYALAVPGRAPALVTELLSSSSDSAAAFRTSLARDAVRAEARAAPPLDVQGCEQAATPSPALGGAGPRQRRIVYIGDDQVARALAERLVAVGRRATATPLSAADFARALRAGSELAYVVALPRSTLAPCNDLAALITSAPWLAGPPLSDALIPLIDTRLRAIVHRDRVSARIDWDGALRMSVHR